MYSLDDIMDVYQQNEFPNNEDIYGWNTFAIEKKGFSGWYQWRRYQLERIGIIDRAFEKQSLLSADLAECRLGGFEGLLKYYREFLTDDNFLTCEQAKIKHAIHAPNLQNNNTLEGIKNAIRSGKLMELNIIGFEKNGIRIIQDGTQRALAITQMLTSGEKVPVKINRYVQVLDNDARYPYIDYYPEEK